jgi:hypothetical protein
VQQPDPDRHRTRINPEDTSDKRTFERPHLSESLADVPARKTIQGLRQLSIV